MGFIASHRLPMCRIVELAASPPPVCPSGLATRGNSRLTVNDVRHAMDRGVNYLNWCGHVDGMSQAVGELGARRDEVFLAWQLQAGAARELDQTLRTLKTDRIDLVTFYYVEAEDEWRRIASEDGAYRAMLDARKVGKVRLLGLTSHQRGLAARIASGESVRPEGRERPLDALMIRYNAAHRGAEQDVFPVTDRLGVSLIAFTCLRWGALLQATPDDPPGFHPPSATEWYRFALSNPSVAVALMAPRDGRELKENLALLDDWRPPTAEERADLIAHGERVRRHAGQFP